MVRVMVLNVIFNNIFSYVVVVSVFGGENRSSPSLTNLITKCCIEYTSPERDSNSERK